MYIKVRFLKDDNQPKGREYTYHCCDDDIKVDDIVIINEKAEGIVTGIIIDEAEIESYKDKIKTIIGKK